jgi:hypothetical protein
VIEKILRPCGLGEESPARDPPAAETVASSSRFKEVDSGRPRCSGHRTADGLGRRLLLREPRIQTRHTLWPPNTGPILSWGSAAEPQGGNPRFMVVGAALCPCSTAPGQLPSNSLSKGKFLSVSHGTPQEPELAMTLKGSAIRQLKGDS